MRIAIIKSNYTPYGGGEKYATKIVNAFVETGAHVDILTAESNGWEGVHSNAQCITMKRFKYERLLRLITFNNSVNRYLKKTRYDCIFGMDRTDYQTHLRAGGGSHAAWIQRRCEDSSRFRCLSSHIDPFHRMMIRIERHAFLSSKLKRIFCNSHLVRNDILRYYPQAVDKIVVIHNGVEWHEFSAAFEERRVKRGGFLKTFGLNNDSFYYLFLGSGYRRKGLKKAIAALGLLPKHIELLVVGKDKNENEYKSFAENMGLKKRIHFFGPQKHVIPFYQASDAFILPTIYDPFSNASLEALAMGLYTVTSRENGCSEVIADGSGYIIEDLKETESVAEAMKKPLDTRLSKEKIRESVKYLDFSNQLNKIVDICISDINLKDRRCKRI